jgi:hypothetical protein
MKADELAIPQTLDAISPEWLTSALRGSGAIRNASVSSLQVKPVALGGFAGQAARLCVGYDRREAGAPAIVFAKLSAADPAVREKLRSVGLFETEAGFYKDVASKPLPMRVPRPYVSVYDDTTGASVLIMEDLGGARFCDECSGCSPEEARNAIRQLGRIHAYFWESPRLNDFKWLRSLDHDVATRAVLYPAMLPIFEQRWDALITPNLRKSARLLGEVITRYYEACSAGPHTLQHGDFRADNFAFRTANDRDELVVFDWQTSRKSRGARDVAYFLQGSMSTVQRREMENSLIDLYYETLSEGGVQGYSREQLSRDVRAGVGAALTVGVIAGGLLDFSNDRAIELVRIKTERLDAMLEDYGFADYLQELA